MTEHRRAPGARKSVATPGAQRSGCYLVPLPLGLVGEPLGAELSLGGVEVAGGVDGIVVDGGEADGDRSPGRPPTRSVRDSLQAVSMPMLRATAQSPVSILFMREPPPCGDC